METVAIMNKVCLEAEAAMFYRVVFDELRHLTPKPTPTVTTAAIAAVDASFQQNAAAIITLTTTGRYVLGQGGRARCGEQGVGSKVWGARCGKLRREGRKGRQGRKRGREWWEKKDEKREQVRRAS